MPPPVLSKPYIAAQRLCPALFPPGPGLLSAVLRTTDFWFKVWPRGILGPAHLYCCTWGGESECLRTSAIRVALSSTEILKVGIPQTQYRSSDNRSSQKGADYLQNDDINVHKALRCHWKNGGVGNCFGKNVEESILHADFTWTRTKPLTLNSRNVFDYRNAWS